MEDGSLTTTLSIPERVSRLETSVEEIEAHLARLDAAVASGEPSGVAVAPAPRLAQPSGIRPRRRKPAWAVGAPAPLPAGPVAPPLAPPVPAPGMAGIAVGLPPPAPAPVETPLLPWITSRIAADRPAALESAAARVAEEPPAPPPAPVPAAAKPVPAPPAPKPAPAWRPAWLAVGRFDALRSIEFWLKVGGIILLLVGVVMLLRVAADAGLLLPEVRLLGAVGIGLVLLGIGWYFRRDRPSFSQVLLGGGIATFYITGFAAYALYPNLAPAEAVFPSMGLVTLLAFGLAVGLDAIALALLGTVGGLLTPFLVDIGGGSVPGLVGFACLVLLGMSLIYLYRGWRLLLWAAFLGGWANLVVALLRTGPVATAPPLYVGAVQAGFVFAWLACWAVPVGREVLAARRPARWPQPPLDQLAAKLGMDARTLAAAQLHLLTVLAAVLTLGLSMLLWPDWRAPVWGWIAAGGALVYGLVAWGLRRTDSRLAYTHAMVGLVLLTMSFTWLLPYDLLFVTLAAEGLALHLVARRFADPGSGLAANLLFLWVEVWFFAERAFTFGQAQPALFNLPALADLAVVGLLLWAGTLIRPPALAQIYRLALHGMVLGWLARELLPMQPYGAYYLLLAAGIYATLLHYLTRRVEDPASRITAHLVFAGGGVFLAGTLGWQILMAAAFEGHGTPLFNWPAWFELGAIGLVVAASLLTRPREMIWIYRAAASLAMLAWLTLQLQWLPGPTPHLTWIMLAWAVYALLLQGVARRWEGTFGAPPSALVGHLAFMGVGYWLASYAAGVLVYGGGPGQPDGLPFLDGPFPFLNLTALVGLAILGALVAASRLVADPALARLYRLACHLTALSLLVRELALLAPGGDGLSYGALGGTLYALGLLMLAGRQRLHAEEQPTAFLPHLVFGAAALWVIWASWQAAQTVAVNPAALLAAHLPAIGCNLAVAGLLGVASFRQPTGDLARAYRLAAHLAALSWLAAILLPLPSGGHWLLLAWAVYGFALLAAGRRGLPAGPEPPATALAHGLFAVAGGAFLWTFWQGSATGLHVLWDYWRGAAPGGPILNVATVTDLAILLLAFGASYLVAGRWGTVTTALIYRCAVHAAVLIWLYRELLLLPNGNVLITAAWGLYGLGVLFIGWRHDFEQRIVYVGLATVALAVAKLVLVDARAEALLGRGLLFLGFGGAFLVLAYYFQNRIRRGPTHGGRPA